jgi:hypothetical protein
VIFSVLTFFAFLIAAILAAILWALSALHAYWGQGGLWPGEDAPSLARRVVGAPGVNAMPSATACYTVAVLLFLAGAWPLALIGLLPAPVPAELMALAGYGLTIVFLGRGIAAYFDAFRRHFPEEPFATLDRTLYGPLCLFIGLGFSFLLILGWIKP